MIVNSDDPKSAAPAAAWAARSGDPILFTTSGSLPADTKAALQSHSNPRIYVFGGPDTVTRFVISQLQEYGTVKRVQPEESTGGPSDLSIAFAKYSDQDFGWNYRDIATASCSRRRTTRSRRCQPRHCRPRQLRRAALRRSAPNHLEQPLKSYLLDVQRATTNTHPATQGFYNRGWILGATTAISAQVQARIDSLLEITRTDSANQLGDASTNTANPEG